MQYPSYPLGTLSMSKQLDSRLYLTAQEAAAALNISVTSLYSYVSRGLIKSQSTGSSRRKGYLRSDITALKNKQRGAKDDPNFFFAPDLKKDKIKLPSLGRSTADSMQQASRAQKAWSRSRPCCGSVTPHLLTELTRPQYHPI